MQAGGEPGDGPLASGKTFSQATLRKVHLPTPGWGLFPLSPMSASGAPQAPGAPPGGSPHWPPDALALAQQLQHSLRIDDRQWHRLKSQRPRRAAEQLAAALVQLLAADDPRAAQPTQARQDAIALLDHAIGWLRAEISDPGCPSHGR